MKSKKLNPIVVIFSDIIFLEQIEKITYNKIELQYKKSTYCENIFINIYN